MALEMKNCYHTDGLSSNQCGSRLVQTIEAPLAHVWSIIRRFENPQGYKRFIKSCGMRGGKDGIGSVREVHVVSGLPAKTSVEQLEELDDDSHVMVFSIVGGDHRLANYRSTTTVHEGEGDGGKTVVTESYMVDVPMDSSEEDTCLFVDTIIRLNLMSLAKITEEMVCEY